MLFIRCAKICHNKFDSDYKARYRISKMAEFQNSDTHKPDYEFAQLSPAEIQDLKSTEDKINQGKSGEVVILAYQKK